MQLLFPDSNNGDDNKLVVLGNPQQLQSIIMFNFTGVSTDWTINQVYLNLSLYSNFIDTGESTDVNVMQVFDAYRWNESNITWNNRPTAATDINYSAESSVTFTDTGEYECTTCFYNWDVTEMFKAQHSLGRSNLTLYLNGTFDGGVDGVDFLYFNSKESGTPSTLQLVVDYTGSATTIVTTALASPLNNTFTNTNDVIMACNSTSEYAIANITLYHDVSSSFISNYTNTTGGTNNTGYLDYQVSSVADGEYSWNCYGTSNQSNSSFASGNFTFTVDTLLPLPLWTGPTLANNSFRNVNSYYVNISYLEINRDVTELDWDGTNETMTCGTGGCYVNKTSLADGIYPYKTSINDSATNSNETGRLTVTIDTTLPSPIILSPFPQQYNFNTSIPLNWSVTETNIERVWYNIDNGPNTTLTGNVTVNVTSGTHTLNLFANDSAVNYNTTSVLFNVDLGAPSVTLDFPSNGSWLTTNTVVLNSTASDSLLDSCQLWGDFGGDFLENQTTLVPKNETTMNWTAITLDDGTYHWNVRCNDTGANAATGLNNFTVYVDTTFPLLHSESNSPTTLYNNYTLTVNITASDVNIGTVWLEINTTGDWINVSMTNISTNYYYDLVSGNFSNQMNVTYRFHANDTAGNKNITEFFYLGVDNRAPGIPTIVTGNATASGFNSIMLNFTGNDPDEDTLTTYIWLANGSEINNTPSTGFNWTNLADNFYRWNVFSGDGYANGSRSENQTVFIDTTPPNFTLTSPTNGSTISGSQFDLTYSVADNLAYSSCWYSVVTSSSGVLHVDNTTLSVCNLSSTTETITTQAFTTFYVNFYVNDTANNLNSTRLYFTTEEASSPSTAGGGSPTVQDDDDDTTNRTVEAPVIPVCGNQVCEPTEDLFNCGVDCPLNLDTLGETLQQAWFIRASFFFIIGATLFMAYKDSTKKTQKKIIKFIPKEFRPKRFRRL